MRICNLGSGSKGNATYIESAQSKILIDAGLSYSDIELRLGFIGVRPEEIEAIFVTHEHSDHIRALDAFSKKHKPKIYAHADCWPLLINKCKQIRAEQRIGFYDNEFEFSDLIINPIRLSHDSSCCFGFMVAEGEKKFSILTDLGQTNNRILESVKNSAIILIEANHDESMLMANFNYPLILKRRILSNRGHLSNKACAEAIKEAFNFGTRQFLLGHLSEQNNTPSLAYNSVCEVLKGYGIFEGENLHIDVCSQSTPSAVFVIGD